MATDQQVPERLYVLAFDHRATLRTMFADVLSAVDGDAQLARLKRVVLDALQRAVQAAPDGWLAPPTSGLLIDEELGAPEAKDAAAAGLTLAMPIERSGAPRFTLEYGDRFAEHVARFPSAWVKALVSLNPSSTNGGYATQIRELARVSEWLRAQGRRFMLEVLVPATPEQLAQVGGDSFRYDCELRAELVCRTIADLYAAGVEPDVWKLEGLETSSDYGAVAHAARSGRPDVACIVLGRGADEERVNRWLRLAAAAEGFRGFAVGRSIWEGALRDLLVGAASREDAVDAIARRYTRFAEVYEEAARRAGTTVQA